MGKDKKDNLNKQYILKGLGCAGCAAKIERKVNSLEEVEEAVLNFSNSTLNICLKEENKINYVEEKVKEIVKNIEPHVVVENKENQELSRKQKDDVHEHNHSHGHNHSHTHAHMEEGIDKKNLLMIVAGTLIFILVSIFKFSKYVQIAMYLLSYVLIGGDIALRAIRNLFKGELFDENFLMFIATVGAFSIGEYPEAVFVMLFYKVGEAFQDRAVNKSRKSIGELMNIRPDKARIKLGNEYKEISPEEVKIEDIILVKPGEKIPLDGVVLDGESMVNTSNLTGESLPRNVHAGEEVLSGFINMNGVLTIKVTKRFSESAVSKILDLVENAGAKKAPTEQFITKFARYYTPIVVFSALALAVIPPIVVPTAEFSHWLRRALIFLVVSCPCALVISVPLGFFAGIGNSSKNGILIKGGNYLEALNNVETLVFDKTGTLTEGVFQVTKVVPNDKISEEELVKYIAYAEAYSNHPIANSIRKYYGKEIDKGLIDGYEEIAGKGIKVDVMGKRVFAGNDKLMKWQDILFKEATDIGTVVYVAVDGEFLGHVVISDKLKNDSIKALVKLKEMGIKNTIMLTGDNKIVGESIGRQLHLDKVYSELLPGDKVEMFEKEQSNLGENKKIAFVGDGVNDAPVLTRADIGIAMGALGSDAAIEAADIVLMTDEPCKLVTAMDIAKFTRKVVVQNIIFALGVKAAVLLLGAFGLANMWEAVFADVGVALIAIFNSMRILKYKPK
ncbi:heavy metal translocating P-type ATPase [Haloimpatiens lingqiaonensis]|uniref:heavy metal translocating P-type ATPase n=1 Tax=Haloimpatiens lingqiaonensis TaxID=1380675 RepID=UPI0010FEC125|nr:heavy metal translocating P-type ATPase [Haloimpatiens lingqiaonensis]